MSRTVTIEPVTRIEGHAKVTVRLGDDGIVRLARMRGGVPQRGFCEGAATHRDATIAAHLWHLPVSHHLTAAKAGGTILRVTIPRTPSCRAS